MRWIKLLLGTKTIQSPGKTNNPRTILFDHTSDIGIIKWGELTHIIEEDRKYNFHNLNLNNFFGKKLSTTPITTAVVSDDII